MRELVNTLKAKGLKIATAESCTGGLLSKLITDIDGASEVFDCGVCSYSNEIKMKLLGVGEDTLKKLGAVSPDVAEQMAYGVAKLVNADIGVGITGIAGPGGGTEQKPVGLVYISVWFDGKYYTQENIFDGNRGTVRQKAANNAINMVKVVAADVENA